MLREATDLGGEDQLNDIISEKTAAVVATCMNEEFNVHVELPTRFRRRFPIHFHHSIIVFSIRFVLVASLDSHLSPVSQYFGHRECGMRSGN